MLIKEYYENLFNNNAIVYTISNTILYIHNAKQQRTMNALENFKNQMRELAGVKPYKITHDPYGFTTFVRKECPVTGKMYELELDTAEFLLWKSGCNIQDAMPDLTDQERDFLITHYTPAEYARVFADVRDEDDGDN